MHHPMDFIVSAPQRDHIERIMRLRMSRRVRLLWSIVRDKRITPAMEAPLVAAIAYVILPVHMVPRKLFFVRAFDDVIVAAAALWLFVKLVPGDVLEEHVRQVEQHGDED